LTEDLDTQIRQQENFIKTLQDAANRGATNRDFGFTRTIQNAEKLIASLKSRKNIAEQKAKELLEPQQNNIIGEKKTNPLLIPAIIIGALILS